MKVFLIVCNPFLEPDASPTQLTILQYQMYLGWTVVWLSVQDLMLTLGENPEGPVGPINSQLRWFSLNGYGKAVSSWYFRSLWVLPGAVFASTGQCTACLSCEEANYFLDEITADERNINGDDGSIVGDSPS